MDRVGDRDMGSFLLSAFRTRYQKILAKAHNAAFTAHSKLLSYLTKEETNRKIYITLHVVSYLSSLPLKLLLHECWLKMVAQLFLVYEAAQSSMAAFKKWRIGGPRFKRASVLGRKRKEASWLVVLYPLPYLSSDPSFLNHCPNL